MMEPEFKTDVVEEHATFTGTVHKLDDYLKSVLGVRQGPKNGQVIPDLNIPKEAFSAARIKGFLEEMADPLFTHVRHICVCHAKKSSNGVSHPSSSMRSNGWIPRRYAPVDSPHRGSEKLMKRWGSTLGAKWYTLYRFIQPVFALHSPPPFSPRTPPCLSSFLGMYRLIPHFHTSLGSYARY